MKKTLIALAVLAAAGAAHAQSNVTIYGAVDINYVKSTGESLTMDQRYNNRLGFMGSEDLGGGLKATFQLEQRFNLNNGSGDGALFDGAANVGLAGNFGQVRFGRVNELSTETYRVIDPFQQYGVAGMIETMLRGDDGNGRLGYTARYDSPAINGFKFGASYTVKNNGGAGDYMGFGTSADVNDPNNGYALSATYTNGPLYLVANYNKGVNAWGAYNWNLGGAYAFGPVRLSLGYEQTKVEEFVFWDYLKTKSWIAGLSYAVGNGAINASYNHSEMSFGFLDVPYSGTQSKYAIGYTHNLSKRTSVYANYAHTKYEDTYYIPNGNGSVVSVGGTSKSEVEVGITHKF